MRVKVNKVWADDKAIYIETEDGCMYGEQFADYPRLHYATPQQRSKFEYDNIGIRWDDLDEDLSFEGFMKKNLPPLAKTKLRTP
jgi:hypothetical protein